MEKFFTTYDFLGLCGCSRLEEEILKRVNEALAKDRYPDFKSFNNEDHPMTPKCDRCRQDPMCHYTEKKIIDSLKDSGIWAEFEKRLKAK